MAPRKLCNDPNPVKIEIPEWPPPHFSTRMREVCEAYSDVLVEELKSGEKMYTPPMEVCMREGYQGFICKKPHAAPLHWKEHIDKEIKKLLHEGVIKCSHGRQATFVSPAHWVTKNKEETHFRLVTDLRHLN